MTSAAAKHERVTKYHKWELRSCARHGHETFRPEEAEFAARLSAATALGECWRCLRCGDFVLGAPRRTGPADQAPIVLRGRALRDAIVLRIFAVERVLRALLLFLAAYAVHRFQREQGALQHLFDQDVPAFRDLGARLHFDFESTVIVRVIRQLLSVQSSTLTWVAVLAAAYGVTQLIEGVGLWLLQRWGEYFAVVATGSFIPFEVYELVHHITVMKASALVVNLALVVYLVASKRLFGVRGGTPAYEAERRAQSLLEVEISAGAEPK